MGETKIAWAHFTFNPWIGCTKVSDACTHCYAESMAKRYGWAKWGAGEPRKRTSADNWKKPLAWDRAANRDGVRRRVFCASLADVFDAEVSNEWRDDLFHKLICKTPNLDWLLLTKRPKVAWQYFEPYRVKGPPSNVWLGTTVENQAMADLRIPMLLRIPATVHFLSCEPLLEQIDISRYFDRTAAGRFHAEAVIDWVICGGESGRFARDMDPEWARQLHYQCRDGGAAFFQKQMGGVRDPRAELGDLPADLRVREFPIEAR
jgi:protein gp37